MDKYDRSIYARDEAERLNCDILGSSPNTLLLDIDTEKVYQHFLIHYPELCKTGLFLSKEELRSRNGNRHIIVQLTKELDLPSRLLLHCLLGSDLVKERLSFERYLNNDPLPSLLFRPRSII